MFFARFLSSNSAATTKASLNDHGVPADEESVPEAMQILLKPGSESSLEATQVSIPWWTDVEENMSS